MSNLNTVEKIKFEKMFGMGSGYVLDFSNRTIQEFVVESINRNIYDEVYDYQSGSKANRVRAIWNKEPDVVVGKLMEDMLEYWRTGKLVRGEDIELADKNLYSECQKITERLKRGSVVENIDIIQAKSDDPDFKIIAKSIKESIEKNEPESAIDRLHTFMIKYSRNLCGKHSIYYDKNTPLHSLFGGYIKHLQKEKIIESEMAERILKSSISILEAFNDVRNNNSLAHCNQILNYNESILIFNDITNVINFVESIETKNGKSDIDDNNKKDNLKIEDIPF